MTTKLTIQKQTLPQTAYRKLVADVSNIFEQARKTAKEEIDRIALRARWAIGRRIVKEEQSGEPRAEYGTELLKKLSRDLSKKYGAGFSYTDLKYMREFYDAYPNWPNRPALGDLGWAHYRSLLAINEKERRDFLGKQAVKNNWSTRKLASEIKKYRDKLSREPVGKVTGPRAQLSVKCGRLDTYKIISVSCGAPSLRVDCGFEISVKVPLTGIKKPAAGDIVEASRTARGYKFKRSAAALDEIYTFVAYVDRVVDGDTIWVTVDCGFDVCVRQKLRLRGIDAPDISTKAGLQAKRFVEERLARVDFIVIKTHKSDKYGRYLVDVFYAKGDSPHGDCCKCSLIR